MVDLNSCILNRKIYDEKNYQDTIEYLIYASKAGIKKMVVTSNFKGDGEDLKFDEVENRINELNKKIEANKLNIKLYYGQVIKVSRGAICKCLSNEAETIRETKYMLVDCEDSMTDEKIDLIFELTLKDIVPVVIHPERYPEVIEKPSRIEKLKEVGCLFQLDINSLSGDYGKKVKSTASKLLKANQYQFVASESKANEFKNIDKFKILSRSQQDLFKKNGLKLLRNENVEGSKESIKEKKFVFR